MTVVKANVTSQYSIINHKVTITVLVENTARKRGLLAEHGLSFWIDAGEQKFLFDTGQGMALFNNAKCLQTHLEKACAVILSHGHYDHCGGLSGILDLAPNITVYAHPAAFETKFKCSEEGVSHEIGIPGLDHKEIIKRVPNLILTEKPTEIVKGFFVTGEIPRQNNFEDTGGPFFLDKSCLTPDPLKDDQALFFETSEGIVVLLGCAHAGVINTLEYIRQLTGNKPIHTVMGGMHLINASESRLKETFEGLRRLDVKHLAPAHCTGLKATVQLWSEFPGACASCNVGVGATFAF